MKNNENVEGQNSARKSKKIDIPPEVEKAILEILTANPLQSKIIVEELKKRGYNYSYREVCRFLSRLEEENKVTKIKNKKDKINYNRNGYVLEMDGRTVYYIRAHNIEKEEFLKILSERIKKITTPAERYSYSKLILTEECIYGYKLSTNERVNFLLQLWAVDIKKVDLISYNFEEISKYLPIKVLQKLKNDLYNYIAFGKNLPIEQSEIIKEKLEKELHPFRLIGLRVTLLKELNELIILYERFLSVDNILETDIKENLIIQIKKKMKTYISNLNKLIFSDYLYKDDVKYLKYVNISLSDSYFEINNMNSLNLTIAGIVLCLEILAIENENISQDLKDIFDLIFKNEINHIIGEEFIKFILLVKPEIIKIYFKRLIPYLTNNSYELFKTDPKLASLINELINWASSN